MGVDGLRSRSDYANDDHRVVWTGSEESRFSECGGRERMSSRRIGIIMNGVTGRMGLNQHLVRSILAIRNQGGLLLGDGSRLIPDPVLVGRNADKVEKIANENGVTRWTTDLSEALAN